MTDDTNTAPCPVCWQPVKPDMNYRIKSHRNSIGQPCTHGTGLPYTTTQHQKEIA